VNEAFVKQFLKSNLAIGKTFVTALEDTTVRLEIVGVVRNARYADLRGPMAPVAYFPFQYVNAAGTLLPRSSGGFIVRALSSKPIELAPALRREVSRSVREFRVDNVRTQEEINRRHTVRERLVAVLALFFAFVAALLAGTGLYGMLDYSVFQRRREIGIRLAIGARPGAVAWRVSSSVFIAVIAGVLSGLGLAMASTRYIGDLLFEVKATDFSALAVPLIAIFATALIAALPALAHALRIDPVEILRAD
jgi:ABC-type lipoprotein release transport system permease subunit